MLPAEGGNFPMKLKDLALCGVFAAVLAVCAWISLPVLDIAFTMQTFGVFLTLEVLGGRRGCLTILVYLLLGAVGAPVFSGFQGGLGALLGVTGGYLWGFLATGLTYWAMTAALGPRLWVRVTGLALGLLACYALGSAWFLLLYAVRGEALALAAVLSKCVIPYLIPDGCKLVLALILARRLRPASPKVAV